MDSCMPGSFEVWCNIHIYAYIWLCCLFNCHPNNQDRHSLAFSVRQVWGVVCKSMFCHCIISCPRCACWLYCYMVSSYDDIQLYQIPLPWGYVFHWFLLFPFLAATKQLSEHLFPLVRPSVGLFVCLSVRHNFLTMFLSLYHLEIFRGYYHRQTWCRCIRSNIKGQGHRGHDLIWPFPDRNSSLNSHMAMKWYTKLDVA